MKMSHGTDCSSCHRNDWKPHQETSNILYKTHVMGELGGRKTQGLVERLSSCLGYAWGYVMKSSVKLESCRGIWSIHLLWWSDSIRCVMSPIKAEARSFTMVIKKDWKSPSTKNIGKKEKFQNCAHLKKKKKKKKRDIWMERCQKYWLQWSYKSEYWIKMYKLEDWQ